MSFTNGAITTAGRRDGSPPGSAPQSSGLVNLPSDVLFKILGMLPIHQFGYLNQTCSQFYLTTTNHPLTQLLSQYFPNFQKTDPHQTDLEAIKEQHFNHSNLTKGVYASHTLQGYTDCVISLALNGQKLFAGSSDGIIKIWDLNTKTCKAALVGNNSSINALILNGQRLISGSDQGTIDIWDLNTNRCAATLQGHDWIVLSLAIDGQKLFSGSSDETIKIWDLSSNKCIATLRGHNGPVNSIALDGQRLFSGSLDATIKIWDLNANACTVTLQGQNGPINSIALDGQRLFSGSSKGVIEIWDLNTNTCIATLQGHNGSVNSLAVKGQRLFSGSSDNTIKIWDLNTNTCTATLHDQNDSVWTLALQENRLLSGSNKIKIRDFNAPDQAIFCEIAELLKSKDPSLAEDAMNRFTRMPPKAKNAIYGDLYQIMAPFTNDYFGCAEHAFHNKNGQSSTPKQRAQAILNYLEKGRNPGPSSIRSERN
ncbi:MAG: WD40 repeat domain-containing protein [Verrucomicrobia bacterium]|nr:WD40 repeat domain-containing protein [Verrucomicrobiota bacterium]